MRADAERVGRGRSVVLASGRVGGHGLVLCSFDAFQARAGPPPTASVITDDFGTKITL